MRRREYLRSAVGAAGLTGIAGSALTAAGSDDDTDASPSAETTTPTPTAEPATTAPSGTTAGAETDGDDGFAPLAQMDVTNDQAGFQTTEAVMEPSGRYAFASRLDGFYVVDCDDPENPEVVGSYSEIESPDGRTMESFNDLKYNRGRLMLATDRGSDFSGIALFDVRDPLSPKALKTYQTGYSIHNADLHGEYAYLSEGTEVEIVHVAPDQPESVATWSVVDYDDAYEDVSSQLRNLHDLYVQDGRAYLAYWDSGSWILDVSDPANPSYLGHVADYSAEELADLDQRKAIEYALEPEGNDHYVQPNDDGSLLAVGGESWDLEVDSLETDEPEEEDLGGPSGIVLWDVSDPSNPEELSEIEAPEPPEGETSRRQGGYYTTSHNFEIAGDYLYSSWYRGGVKVHDISDPESPEQLAHWEDGYQASFWTAQVGVPGEFFVGTSYLHPTEQDGPGGFYTFPDPSDSDATVTPSGEPVDLSTPESTATPTETATETPTPSATESPTATTEATQTATATPESTEMATDTATSSGADTGSGAETDSGTDTDASGGSGPGLGVLSGLAGLGLGAWRLTGSADENEE
ncbi:LVIVD repeat-containing protein [Halosimplex salinum]|uniref:LVIVD repeat-containing protein n=1 Tax=Halosimplex salinum TaxID=1710538 RepID=UPI000F48B1BD|nr:hypothetical protein [Halosimplex salinum]